MPKEENSTTEATAAPAKKSGLGAGAITGIALGGVAIVLAAGFGGAAIGQSLGHHDRPNFSQQDQGRGHGDGDGDRDGFGGRHHMDGDGDQGQWSPGKGMGGQQPLPAPGDLNQQNMGPQNMGPQNMGPQTGSPQTTQPQGAPQQFRGGIQGPGGFNGWTGGS